VSSRASARVSSHGSQASCAACAQNANGLAASTEIVAGAGWHGPDDARANPGVRIRLAYLANDRVQLRRDLRSANRVARSPAPIRSKPSAVPANDGLRPDNRNRGKDGGEPSQTNRKRSVLLRCRRFGARRRSTLIFAVGSGFLLPALLST
jgi:hypothetical protein